jgi:hypothetical protein
VAGRRSRGVVVAVHADQLLLQKLLGALAGCKREVMVIRISVTNLNDLQTQIFRSAIRISVFKDHDVLSSVKNIARVGFGLDHLATLPGCEYYMSQMCV